MAKKYTVKTRLLHSGETYLPGSEVELDAVTADNLLLLSVIEEAAPPEPKKPPAVVSKVTRKKADEPEEAEVVADVQANG